MNIEIPIMKPWIVKIPEVYRYMDQEYIDRFFENGNLRLSSFYKFKKHQDEQRQDAKEGENVIVGRGDSSTVLAHTFHGDNSFIFCTSQLESKEVMASFKCNGYFKIRNTSGFAVAVSNALADFINGIEGSCIYSEFPFLNNQMDNIKLDDFRAKDDGNKIDLNKFSSLMFETGGTDVFFTKSPKYLNQMEYRFVWNVNYSVPEHIDIICKEAAQFCQKIT